MQIAVDTSVLVAWLNHDDVWNIPARALKKFFLENNIQPTYFDCAVSEAISAAVRRLHEKKRGHEVVTLFTRLETLVPAELITWILPDVPRLYSAALDLMRTSSGELNFNDALIALACREREIPAIASFDADFDQVAWLKRVAKLEDV
ncbi:MAG: type II toxin-antitoxin system VapC family toxin [Anaerolineae bacterium]|nr:type II toxin-antitoxin system VapC family toxin [Anaerolineae bacterium]